MQTLWFKMFGNAKVDSYEAGLAGAYYVSKLAAHPNGEFKFDNLELLLNKGPSDLLLAAETNPYVPAHLKDRPHGEFLVVRITGTRRDQIEGRRHVPAQYLIVPYASFRLSWLPESLAEGQTCLERLKLSRS